MEIFDRLGVRAGVLCAAFTLVAGAGYGATYQLDVEFERTGMSIFGYSGGAVTSDYPQVFLDQPDGAPSCFTDPATATSPERFFCSGRHDLQYLHDIGLFDLELTGWKSRLSATFTLEVGESPGYIGSASPSLLDHSCVGAVQLCGVVNDVFMWSFDGADLFATNMTGGDSLTILDTAAGRYTHVGYISDYGTNPGPGASSFSFLDLGVVGIGDIGYGGFGVSYALVGQAVTPVSAVPLGSSGGLLASAFVIGAGLVARRRRTTGSRAG